MASTAVAGVKTLFRRWSGTAWVNIGEISQITGPGMTRDIYEVTSFDSTEGYKEYIAGLRDGGSLSLTMNFTRATFDLMQTDFEDDTVHNFEIVLPDAENTSIELEGWVSELGLDIPVADKVSSNVTIKITGPVTVNSGSGS